MNYIVFDLEWNQGTEETTVPQIPFEIIEIGAVKLNQHMEQIDTFQMLIRPQIYKVMNREIHKLVSLEMTELKKRGVDFPEAVKAFLDWCGDEQYRFCTWGTMDLAELQKNMDYYHIPVPFAVPVYYYDVQRCYGVQYPAMKKASALEDAVEHMHIGTKGIFHRAYEDAEYTAQVFMHLDRRLCEEHISVDLYQNPKNRAEELFMQYPEYRMHVTREFACKEDILKDDRIRSIRCHVCGRSVKCRIRWFSANGQRYLCLGQCPEHGYVLGKIRVKRTGHGSVFGVKYLKMVGEQEAALLRARRNELRIKRREKKKKHRKDLQVKRDR